ncbi:MAG: GIY-YIG nuclease family protein [Patescibacteria group bacterium]
MIPERVRVRKGRLPEHPGVYLMYGSRGNLLYVGKAANLRRRVTSYFVRANDARIERLVSEIRRINYRETDTAIEALILEAELIKKFRPPYNVKEKDDKSFLSVVITREPFPRVLLVRNRDATPKGDVLVLSRAERFGPFTSAGSIREALRILRRIFPWSEHVGDKKQETREKNRPCFNYEVGLCPGTCIGAITKTAYMKNIARVRAIFRGRKKDVVRFLKSDMRAASKALHFEEAAAARKKVFALTHIRDIALVGENKYFEPRNSSSGGGSAFGGNPERPFRIEGYDISNISGTSAVGSMVVFEDGEPKKSDYRKFHVRTVAGPDDFAMLKEVVTRRLTHLPPKGDWSKPDLILVDGGAGQITAARKALKAAHVSIRVIGMVKGRDRKRTDVIGIVPTGVAKETLVRARDEAHRFAIRYHRQVRQAGFLRA